MRLLEDDSDAPAQPPSNYIQVTQEEKAAIDRLADLGFDKQLAIEAFFACDKNEELAANYLFDAQLKGDFQGNSPAPTSRRLPRTCLAEQAGRQEGRRRPRLLLMPPSLYLPLL